MQCVRESEESRMILVFKDLKCNLKKYSSKELPLSKMSKEAGLNKHFKCVLTDNFLENIFESSPM